VIVNGSLSGSLALPLNAIATPVVPLYGPPALAVGGRFGGGGADATVTAAEACATPPRPSSAVIVAVNGPAVA
jgi:hypothetical protein